jgi:hypothetical protein
MKLHHMTLVPFIAIGITVVTFTVSAQPTQPNTGSQAVNPNAVGSQGISPPVSGNFGVTPAPGAIATPGYAPGAAPSSGVAGGAGPGMSSGAPFSGTGYGMNSTGRTPTELGATIPSPPATGAQGGVMRPGGTSTNPALGSGLGAGSPGPSMGTTPSSGAMAPGAGAGTGAGGGR